MKPIRIVKIILAIWVIQLAVLAGSKAENRVVAFGLSDDLGVFSSEARTIGTLLAKHYAAGEPAIVRSNSARRAGATLPVMTRVLRGVVSEMEDDDVLILFLTSHGTRKGLSLAHGKSSQSLSPADLRLLFHLSGVKKKVLIISACYSGIFTALADPNTLVFTAADRANPSFGCTSTAKLTIFGKALSDLIPATKSLPDAFRLAKKNIGEVERSLCREDPASCGRSNPQIAGGSNLIGRLRATTR